MRHLDQFREKPLAGVCGTFAFATETTIEELKNCSKNEIIAESTGFGSCLEEVVRRKGNYF